MATFTQEIDFTGNFRRVQAGGLAVANKVAGVIEGAYKRTLTRLSQVNTTLARVSSRVASSVAGGVAAVGKGALGAVALGGAVGVLGTGLAAATGKLSETIERADKLTKLRGPFDPVTYQRLQVAAEKADASIEDVEKASLTLNRTLSGTKLPENFASALQSAGISAAALRKAAPEQQIRMIADAVAKVEDPSKQAGLAMTLFGEAGVKLVPMLKDGGDAIKGLGDAAEKQGRIIGQTAIDASAALNDSLDRVSEPLHGLVTTILTSIIPPLADALDGLAGFLSEHIGSFRAGVGVAVRVVEVAIGLITHALDAFRPILATIYDAWTALLGGVSEGGDIITQAEATITELVDVLAETLMPILDVVIGAFFEIVSALKTGVGPAIDLVVAAFKLLGSVVGAAEDETSVFGKLLSGPFNTALDIVTTAIKTISTLFAGLAETLALFSEGRFIDGFIRLGRSLVDGLLEPLRMITRQIITLADAVPGGSYLVPDAVREFAFQARSISSDDDPAPGGSFPSAVIPMQQSTPRRMPVTLDEEDTTSTGKGSGKGKAAGTSKGASAGKTTTDNVIRIAARGITVPLGAPDAQGKPPALALQMPNLGNVNAVMGATASGTTSPSQQRAGEQPLIIDVGGIHISIQGANVDNTEKTMGVLRRTAEDAVLSAFDQARARLLGRKRS